METKKNFKIVILEDSMFFNNLITKQIDGYTAELGMDKGIHFEIQSFTNAHDFLMNFRADTDIAFIDYFLGSNVNGIDVLKEIKAKSEKCKVIIVSQAKTVTTSLLSLLEGAAGFVFKDKDALLKTCFIVEDTVNEKFAMDVNKPDITNN